MIQSSKSIEGLKPEQPLTEVARQSLRQRLRTVWDYAPLAAKKFEEDIEYVHQLRVATRRARAALQIFGDLVPQGERRRMKKMLRGLRQAAGDARDLDVLGERLGKIAKKKGSHLGAVVEQIANRRRKAQKPLTAAYKGAKLKRFKKRSRGLENAVSWESERPEPTFGKAARMTLAPLVNEFFAAAQADLTDIEALHQMRIAGKQVRYAMELLAGAFDRSFRGELYATFAEVQEKLGTINDHATAIVTFNQWSERADYNGSRAELAELIANEEQQLDATCQQFREWWNPQRGEDLARQFETVLETVMLSTAEEESLRRSNTGR